MQEKIIYEEEFKRMGNLFKIKVFECDERIQSVFYHFELGYFRPLSHEFHGLTFDYEESKTWFMYESISKIII